MGRKHKKPSSVKRRNLAAKEMFEHHSHKVHKDKRKQTKHKKRAFDDEQDR